MGNDRNPLRGDVANDYGERLGVDLSDVRIHTGAESGARSAELGARAFAEGTDVHFAEDEYDEASDEGRELLAHELVHVAQAKKGASGVMTKRADGASVGDHEQEADRGAHALVHGRGPVEVAAAPAPIMRKEKSAAAKSPTDVATKLTLIAHQLQQTASELEHDKDHATENGGRAGGSLNIAANELGTLLPAFQALSPAKRAPLRAAIAQIARAGAQIADKRPGAEIGSSFLKGIVACYFPDVRDEASAPKAAAKDNLPLIRNGLDQVAQELKAADESNKEDSEDLLGPCGIETLAAVHELIHEGLKSEDKKVLRARVEELAGTANDVAGHAKEGAPRARELLVRMAAVCDDVHAPAPPRVASAGSMQALMKDEQKQAKLGNMSQDQGDRFDKAAEKLRGGADFVFAAQMAAVEAVRDQSEEKDPPKSDFWKSLALNALSAAAAAFLPVVGGMIMKKVGGAFGPVVHAATDKIKARGYKFTKNEVADIAKEQIEAAERAREAFGRQMAEGGKEAGAKLAEKEWDVAKEKLGEKEPPKGTGDSGYFKSDFFDTQRMAVILAAAEGRDAFVDAVYALKSTLAEHPEEAIHGLEKLGTVKADKEILGEAAATQKEHTRAAWVSALAHNAIEGRADQEKEARKTAKQLGYHVEEPKQTQKEKEEAETVEHERGTNLRNTLKVDEADVNGKHLVKYGHNFDGLISIVFEGSFKDPTRPIKLKDVSLAGINKGMTKNVAAMKLKDVKIPYRALASGEMFGDKGMISLGRNETGHIFEETKGIGDTWLDMHGGAKGKEAAAQKILEEEIGNHPLFAILPKGVRLED